MLRVGLGLQKLSKSQQSDASYKTENSAEDDLLSDIDTLFDDFMQSLSSSVMKILKED